SETSGGGGEQTAGAGSGLHRRAAEGARPGAEQEGAAPARSGAEPVQGGLSWRTRRGAAEHPRPAQPRCFEPVLKRGKAGCVAQHGSDISNREHKRLVYRGMTARRDQWRSRIGAARSASVMADIGEVLSRTATGAASTA